MSNSETLFLYASRSSGPTLFFRTFPIDTVFSGCRCISATSEPHELDLEQCVPFRKCSTEEMGIFRNVYIAKPLWHNTIAEFGHPETDRTIQSSGQNTRTVDLTTNRCYLSVQNTVWFPMCVHTFRGLAELKEFCGTVLDQKKFCTSADQ